MSAIATIILAATLQTSPSLETAMSFGKLGTRPPAGSVRVDNGQPRYNLRLDIALEHYRDGTRDAERDLRWFLTCESRPDTSCRLTQTTLDHWGKAVNLGTICYESIHTTADRTLEVIAADWPQGKLELNVLHGDGSKTHALIRLAYVKDDIQLDSLAATVKLRGADPASKLELRVPDYTYVQQVSMVMKGLRSEWERDWEALLRSFSPQDQAIARRLAAAREEIVARVVEALYKASEKARLEQPVAAKELSDRLSAEAGATFVQYVTEWLETSEMSAPAKSSIIEFLRSH